METLLYVFIGVVSLLTVIALPIFIKNRYKEYLLNKELDKYLDQMSGEM